MKLEFVEKGSFSPKKLISRVFFGGGTLAALQYFVYYLYQLDTSRKSLKTNY